MTDKLIIAISSRALFNLDESHTIFEQAGIEAYQQHQRENENQPLPPGVAFPLVKKLLALTHPETHMPLVEIVLLSRNSSDTGLRVFNSIQHHGLNMTRAVFTQGESPYQYIHAFHAHLFLSANPPDVAQALAAGCAAATLLPGSNSTVKSDQIRIAFDADAVVFSDESERVYQEHGIAAFEQNESLHARVPLSRGPFQGFLAALHALQQHFTRGECPIRTALVTARGAPSHERVVRTLRAWNIRIDEALFLGGLDKGDFLRAFGADIFFDDQKANCESARQHVATGHVPHGVVNR